LWTKRSWLGCVTLVPSRGNWLGCRRWRLAVGCRHRGRRDCRFLAWCWTWMPRSWSAIRRRSSRRRPGNTPSATTRCCAFLNGSREALAGLLRPGNAGSNTTADHITVLDQALTEIPDAHRCGTPILIRCDSASCTHDGEVRDGAQIAEITGLVPAATTRLAPGAASAANAPHPGAQLSLFDTIERFRHQVIASDTPTDGGSLQPATAPTPASRTASDATKTPASAASLPVSSPSTPPDWNSPHRHRPTRLDPTRPARRRTRPRRTQEAALQAAPHTRPHPPAPPAAPNSASPPTGPGPPTWPPPTPA
jgi:hypothetical protein